MPKRKVFVEDFGRSSKYAIQRNATEEMCDIVIPGDEDDEETLSLHHGSSRVGSVSSTLSPLSNPNYSTPTISSNDSEMDENTDAGSERNMRDGDESNGEEYDSDDSRTTAESCQFNVDSDVDFDVCESDDEDEHDAYQPLYAGAPITLGESMVAILTFALCHNLTGSAICDLLTLISLTCRQPNLLTKSLYMFRKYFSNMRYPIVKHCFCSICFSRLETGDSICEICNEANGVSYFIEIPILSQLQVLFKRRGFYQSLQHRFHRIKKSAVNFEDIYDGKIYKELSDNNGFLSNPDNISFTWNTDGVPIFKSSGYQIWPLYLSINELPYAERTKSDNILLVGLWFGPHKPMPNLFLRPFHSALHDIYQGVYLNVPTKDDPVKVRGMIICGTCDLPAKALFLNMTQFNGQYGCPKCKIRGESVERVWTYPFESNLNSRTDGETHDFAEEALRINAPVFGVKGPSLLSFFVHKLIRTTAVDSMHCAFSGITKKLCTIFFDPAYNDHPASLSNFIDLVDSRLCSFSPPSFIQRRPRSIKHIKYWKANELKAWLFYYSLPILHDIMPVQYFEHYCMLVIGIFALHQASISPDTLEYASRLLKEFVNRFDILYGKRHMSCNLHQLLHIHETVLDFGPLWITSCFPFEDLNGKLKRLIHSSKSPGLQICSAVSTFLNMTTLRHQNLVYGSPIDEYCRKLSNPQNKMKLQHLSEGISSIGRCREIFPLPQTIAEALDRANITGRKFLTFSRLRKNYSLYTAQSYSRAIKYDNTCVQYIGSNDSLLIGIVHSFIKVYSCNCWYENVCECHTSSYAIIRPCLISSVLPRMLLRNVPELLLECTNIAEQAVAINVEQLIAVCFMLKVKDTQKSYVALSANTIEAE